MKQTEHRIQSAILERLGYVKNGYFYRQNSGMVKSEYGGKTRMWRAGVPGIADIMGVYHGYAVAIEVKQPGKKLNPNQIQFREKFILAGGIYFICTDAIDVVSQLATEIEKKKGNYDVSKTSEVKEARPDAVQEPSPAPESTIRGTAGHRGLRMRGVSPRTRTR